MLVRLANDLRFKNEMAEKLGEQEDTYSMWERGDSPPAIAKLTKLRAVTGASLDYLWCGDLGSLRSNLRDRVILEAKKLGIPPD